MAQKSSTYLLESDDASAAALPLTTYGAYRQNTDITNKRRDALTKKIDALVAHHLASPDDPKAWYKLSVEAPKYLERLQRSSPMRHALVSTQLNLIYSQAAAAALARRAHRFGLWPAGGQDGASSGIWRRCASASPFD